MAEQQSNAPVSGVIHVRTRLTANFTLISNRLAQRPGSAVTVGVAVYILSLPDGAPVSITALCKHFTEGEVLVARALRELEADGYLERRRERVFGGRFCTRTLAYDVPRASEGEPDPTPPGPPTPPRPTPPRSPKQPKTPKTPNSPKQPKQPRTPRTPKAPKTSRSTRTSPPSRTTRGTRPRGRSGPTGAAVECTAEERWPRPEVPVEAPDPVAVTVLASLRGLDPRLMLSEAEVRRLAPGVVKWLERGVRPHEVAAALADRLPALIERRPARILAYRLEALLPPAVEAPTPGVQGVVVLPMQTCDGCERAFRAAEPRLCAECRAGTARAGAAVTVGGAAGEWAELGRAV